MSNPLVTEMLRRSKLAGDILQREYDAKVTPVTDKAEKVRKAIDGGNFGCQKGNVTKLMEALLGESLTPTKTTASVTLEGPHGLMGAVLVRKSDGKAGLVWSNTTNRLREGYGKSDFDYYSDEMRAATEAEIITYIKQDEQYIQRSIVKPLMESVSKTDLYPSLTKF